MVKHTLTSKGDIIILSPNRSASWKQIKQFILIAWCIIAIIAVSWAMVGAWIVLPFAGLEMALLGYFMYRVSMGSYQQQVISIDQEKIVIESGITRPESRARLERDSAHLHITEANNTLDPATLTLKDHQQSVHIGTFLSKEDIEVTRQTLQSAGIRTLSNHWWKYQ
ncbi:DUF2244 domain-containing protein [Aestuariibacter sp. AA17]|uniref:DUF2244 domain-containing protein n=1 Tax=Fluctibacter corallii TaxID=2984329 RepID=A0ABT3A8S1_9ALTE|nr:DUF2244 domain-containing protein [Aestuariibacter sp. AA17]MCV2885090.1 DUF2244 domain-containing protein [Aestuariibacter sp. AA17]